MATPTRLAVLLHSRKLASAGRTDAVSPSSVNAHSNSALTAALVIIPCLIAGSASTSGRQAVNNDSAKVGHVGECWAGPKQAADSIEKPRRIVVGEKRGGIEAGGPGLGQCGRLDKGPGRVVRTATAAVGTVGVGGEPEDAGGASEVDGKRQGVFLIGTALALAAQRDGEFAARQDGDAAALRGVVAGERGMFGGDLPRLALQAVAEDHGGIAGGFGPRLGGGERVGRPGDNPVGGVGKDR